MIRSITAAASIASIARTAAGTAAAASFVHAPVGSVVLRGPLSASPAAACGIALGFRGGYGSNGKLYGSSRYDPNSGTDLSARTASTDAANAATPAVENGQAKWTKLADPAPGSPFHHAFPVHDLDIAKKFYSEVLGCAEGRSSTKWQDYSLHGHQIVCHWVGNDYRCQDYYNPVDGDEVPVPHFGLALTEEQFHDLANRVRAAEVEFIIEPHLRFQDQPGEQWTMFFKDPSGNNLEFKAMRTVGNLFAKYNVVD